MNSLNSVNISGFVGSVNTNEDNKVLNISLAVSYDAMDKEKNEKIEKTHWIDCVGFGENKVKLGKKLETGQYLIINGHLQTSVFQKDGEETKRKNTRVIIDNVIFAPSKK